MSAPEQRLWELITVLRREKKLPALKPSKICVEDSREWAKYLFEKRSLFHWVGSGENAAVNQKEGDAEMCFRQWRGSSAHNAFLHTRRGGEDSVAGVGIYKNYYVFRAFGSIEDYAAARQRHAKSYMNIIKQQREKGKSLTLAEPIPLDGQ